MSFTSSFTIAIVILLLRIFWVRLKAANMRSESFKRLPPKDQLAVLKECLLNNPTETNLQNLKAFTQTHHIDADVESYRPFMKRQLELSKKPDALIEDNLLYTEESQWIDSIRPLELSEAEEALSKNDEQLYIQLFIEGIARLYSDDAIIKSLQKISGIYPKAAKLIESYKNLMEVRDQSLADEKSLEALRKLKEEW